MIDEAELKPLEEAYDGEIDPMIEDTLSQFENIRNNETVDVSLNEDCEGTD